MDSYKLKFVGHGAIPGIPGRDLDLEEVDRRGLDPAWLISTGLWVKEEIDKPKKTKEPVEVSDARK